MLNAKCLRLKANFKKSANLRIFSRKLILYENLVNVPIQVKRARNVKDVNFKQNLDFSIISKTLLFQNPIQNVKILILQNGQFNTAITNIKPMFTVGNDLVYKYDAETQFWGGNEFNFFENKDVRAANNTVSYIDSKGIYNTHLFANNAPLALDRVQCFGCWIWRVFPF